MSKKTDRFFYSIFKRNDGMLDSGLMKVKVVFHFNATEEKQILAFFEEITNLFAREKPFLILYDALEITFDTSLKKLMLRFQAFMMEREEASSRLIRGCAVIINNPVVKGIAAPIMFFKPAPYPLKLFGKMEEGEVFLQSCDSISS